MIAVTRMDAPSIPAESALCCRGLSEVQGRALNSVRGEPGTGSRRAVL